MSELTFSPLASANEIQSRTHPKSKLSHTVKIYTHHVHHAMNDEKNAFKENQSTSYSTLCLSFGMQAVFFSSFRSCFFFSYEQRIFSADTSVCVLCVFFLFFLVSFRVCSSGCLVHSSLWSMFIIHIPFAYCHWCGLAGPVVIVT